MLIGGVSLSSIFWMSQFASEIVNKAKRQYLFHVCYLRSKGKESVFWDWSTTGQVFWAWSDLRVSGTCPSYFCLSMGLTCLKLCTWHPRLSCGLLLIWDQQAHKELRISKGCPTALSILYVVCIQCVIYSANFLLCFWGAHFLMQYSISPVKR